MIVESGVSLIAWSGFFATKALHCSRQRQTSEPKRKLPNPVSALSPKLEPAY